MSDLTIGVVAASRLAAGLVSGSELAGAPKAWPEGEGAVLWNLASMPVEAIVEAMAKLMLAACGGADCRPVAAGIAFPGIVRAGVVEDSNVDLTAELVNMITAQRAYQANAQTIKTQDSVLQTIVNLR